MAPTLVPRLRRGVILVIVYNVYTIVRSHSPPGGRGTALKKTNLIQHDDEANCPWKIDKILMI